MENEYYLVFSNGGYCEFMGSSGADKPTTGFTTGILTETDTGKVFFWDIATSAWVEQFAFQA